jgi:hypothetical protein
VVFFLGFTAWNGGERIVQVPSTWFVDASPTRDRGHGYREQTLGLEAVFSSEKSCSISSFLLASFYANDRWRRVRPNVLRLGVLMQVRCVIADIDNESRPFAGTPCLARQKRVLFLAFSSVILRKRSPKMCSSEPPLTWFSDASQMRYRSDSADWNFVSTDCNDASRGRDRGRKDRQMKRPHIRILITIGSSMKPLFDVIYLLTEATLDCMV